MARKKKDIEENSVEGGKPKRKYKKNKLAVYTKAYILEELCKRTGFYKKDVSVVLSELRLIFEEAVAKNEDMVLNGMFKMHVATIPPRKGWDGFKKEYIDLPEVKRVKVHASPNLNGIANGWTASKVFERDYYRKDENGNYVLNYTKELPSSYWETDPEDVDDFDEFEEYKDL